MSNLVTERTSRGLQAVMFEEIDNLRNGRSTPQAARAKAAVANTICLLSRLEMDFARFVAAERTEIDSALPALPMGVKKSLTRK